MNWFENRHHNAGDSAEDLAYPPSGGKVKLISLGIALPLVILWFAIEAWTTQETFWFGHRSTLTNDSYKIISVKGRTAQSLAVTWLGAALFSHFRWCWGLIPVYRVFEIGSVIALILIPGGLGFAARYHFF